MFLEADLGFGLVHSLDTELAATALERGDWPLQELRFDAMPRDLLSGRLAREADVPQSGAEAIPRVATEEAAKAAAMHGVNVSIVRLPPSVHGDGDHGFVPLLIRIAREKGTSAKGRFIRT